MGFLNMFGGADINSGVRDFQAASGAVLLDVRSAGEYSEGRIPGSINVPLNTLPTIEGKVPDKNTPLFVYCLSGARAGRAVAFLEKQGYTNVRNIGGINLYNGPIES